MGASNSVVIRVRAIDRYGQYSGYLNGTFSNPAPSIPSGLSYRPWMNGIKFLWNEAPEDDVNFWQYRIQVESEGWSGWIKVTSPEVIFFLDDDQSDGYNNSANVHIEVQSIDTFGNTSGTAALTGITGSFVVPPSSISDISQLSNAFEDIPVLVGESFSDNDPAAGNISWNAHSLYFNGTEYNIGTGYTSSRYIYWINGDDHYSAADSDPTSGLSSDDFIIAENLSGTVQMAWNAEANSVIGSAYIKQASIIDLHVVNLSGNKIIANTIVASKIKGSDFGDLVISSGTITIEATDGLNISGGGNILVEDGSDITLQGSDTDPGLIKFKGSTYTTVIGADANGNRFLIEPASATSQDLFIGDSYLFGNLFNTIRLNAYNVIYINCIGDPTQDESNIILNPSGSASELQLQVLSNGSGAQVQLYRDATLSYLGPVTNKNVDLGRASAAFDDVYGDDFNNVADVPFLDDVKIDNQVIEIDDLEVIIGMQRSSTRCGRTGMCLINDSTLPKWFVSKHEKYSDVKVPFPKDFNEKHYKSLIQQYLDEPIGDSSHKREIVCEIDKMLEEHKPHGQYYWAMPGDRIATFEKGSSQYNVEGKPYISTKTHLGLHDGAFRQLIEEQQQIHSMIEYLQTQIVDIEGRLNG